MSKLVEASAEFLSRDTSTKGNHREFSEAMNPMKKKMEAMDPAGMHRMSDGTMMKNSDMKKKMGKKVMDESFLLSQEEFQALSEEDREYYIDQLMELKNGMMKKKMGEAMNPMNKKKMEMEAMNPMKKKM